MAIHALQLVFEDASYVYTKTVGYVDPYKVSTAKKSLAFIQGTSLEIMIKSYALGYDAEGLRAEFYTKFHLEGL